MPSPVRKLLSSLRDAPLDTESVPQEQLEMIYKYLVAVPSGSDNILHWFCHRAQDDTVEAATFLIRMYAYDKVDEWKVKLENCLTSCTECICAFEQAKFTSRSTYFGAYTEDLLTSFYQIFEGWELKTVVADLEKAQLLPQPASAMKTLASINTAISYRIVSNWTLIQNATLYSVIQNHPPPGPLSGWSNEPVPPGILLLLLDQNISVRSWAEAQIAKCETHPMHMDDFTGTYVKVAESIANHLNNPESDKDLPHKFCSDLPTLWAGVRAVLRYLPPSTFQKELLQINFPSVVARHLHDTGPHLREVLQCFLLLLKRLRGALWEQEGPEFPQVVFDSVKDNGAFSDLIQSIQPQQDRPWFLGWFAEFLSTLHDRPAYGDVFAKAVDFLCEETQHERFKDARPLTMLTAVRLLGSALNRAQDAPDKEKPRYMGVFQQAIDIHSEILLKVAFTPAYANEKWSKIREITREFITSILQIDIDVVLDATFKITKLLSQVSRPHGNFSNLRPITIRSAIWKRIFSIVESNDQAGIALLTALVSRTAHVDILVAKQYEPTFKAVPNEGCEKPDNVLRQINESLGMFRNGFLPTTTRYADDNTSMKARKLMKHPGTVRQLIRIVMSPLEELQDAAQVLIGLAFDVEGRQECLRALVETPTDEAFEGIFDYLSTFQEYAPQVPEACNLAKVLVRCFTDIIEVMCGSDALLSKPTFLAPTQGKTSPASRLLNLWTLMTKALTVIFKRTPVWSPYFDNDQMVHWMRDALIFGRDMLENWRVFEKGANLRLPNATEKRGKLSSVGKKMIDALQEILPELTRWLRLTDEELLHQAFALLTTFFSRFKETGIVPSDDAIARIRKSIDTARKGEKDATQMKSRLSATMLVALENALDDFEDVVEIVSTPKPFSAQVKELPHKSVIGSSKLEPSNKVSKPKQSHYFTEEDQQKLDADVPMPSFRRSNKDNASASSKDAGKVAIRKDESSSDDSDSNEEEGGGLAGLAKLQRTPTIKKKPAERRQIMTMDIPTQKNPMQERIKRREETRNAALRLNPDISEFHRTILAWNYEHTGSVPPGRKMDLSTVPDRFKDYSRYREVFEPLILLDVWAQIQQAKEETTDVNLCKVTSRQFSDQWLEIDVLFLGSLKKDWYLTDTDLVIVKEPATQKSVMAKTLSYKSIPAGLQQGTIATLRCFAKNDPGLQINTQWGLSKLVNLTTSQREYAALVSLPYYDHFDSIMQPRIPTFPKIDPSEIRNRMVEYSVNEPQAKAICGTLRSEGFVLIQGPPGTGKTTTICTLVSASLLRSRSMITVGQKGGRGSPPSGKILLCAPSNAAIDEIASRIHTGAYKGKKPQGLKVVRLGAKAAMSTAVQEISLDSLVESRVERDQASSGKPVDASAEIQALQREIEAVKQAKAQKEQEKENTSDNGAHRQVLANEVSQLRARQTALIRDLNRRRDDNQSRMRDLDAKRRTYRMDVLQEADVICSTLSGSALDILGGFEFEMIIIDEAAQAVELSTLIPLKYRSTRCVMVGDPQQLPPTVISQEACRYRYNESLFVRLQKHRPESVHLLSIQYRMHPDISVLPSRVFYQGRLQDGPDMAVKTKQPWHANPRFGTYRFYNINGVEETGSRASLKNMTECHVAVALYSRLTQEYSDIDFSYRIGIVSMYRAQIIELKRQFEQRFGRRILDTLDFNTVDGFQGQEKDIIILSCVRSGPGLTSIGFLSDYRRMNVAITRAKSSLFILGNAPTLERSDENWRNIIADAQSRSALHPADTTYFTSSKPIVPPSPAKSQPKASASQKKSANPEPPTALPADLVAPRDFKPPAPSESQASTSMKLADALQGSKGPQVNGLPPRGMKRPLDESGSGQQPGPAKPKQPPVKRPKQAPNLFIPKNKQTRP